MAKKAVDLSVNSIVMIVFAITVLGLGLAFIRGSFSSATEKFTYTAPEIEATANEPIVLPFETVNAKKNSEVDFSLNFYNNEEAVLDEKPVITACVPEGLGDTSLMLASVAQSVQVGSTATYKALLTVPASAPSQKYACNLQIGKTGKQFFIQVQ